MVQCRFCKQQGHNISSCKHESIQFLLENLKIEFRNIHNRRKLFQALNSKSDDILAMYAKSFGIKSSLPKSVHINQLFTILHNQNIASFEEMSLKIEELKRNLPAHIGMDFNRNSREIAMQIEFVMHYYPDISYAMIENCIEDRVRRTNNLSRIEELRTGLQIAVIHLFTRIAQDVYDQEPQTPVWKVNRIVDLSKDVSDDVSENIGSCQETCQEKKECPVCMNDFLKKNMVVTNCHHLYCAPCIDELIEKTTTNTKPPGCALCRTVIDTLTVKS